MTYKNNNFLSFIIIIIILLCVLYLYKTNENEFYTDSYNLCLTETDYKDLEKKINYLESVYEYIIKEDQKVNDDNDDEKFNVQLQQFINNLLNLFDKLTTIPISCILNDKKQLDILNRMIGLLDKNKNKIRTIKNFLMDKFNKNIHSADILSSKKILKLNTLNSLSNLFNNISYIFNNNHNYTINDNNDNNDNVNILDKKISPKQQKECGFLCKHNNSYKDPKLHEEPAYKHLHFNINN